MARRKGSAEQPKREPRTVAYLKASTPGQETEKNKADVLLLFVHDRGFGKVELV